MSVTPFPLERARPPARRLPDAQAFTEADRAVLAPVHYLISDAEARACLVATTAARAGVARLLEEGRARLSSAGLSLGIAAAQALSAYDAALRMILRSRPTDSDGTHAANEARLQDAAETLADVSAALFRVRHRAHQ